MKNSVARITLAIALFAPAVCAQQSLDAMVDRELPQLVNVLRGQHTIREGLVTAPVFHAMANGGRASCNLASKLAGT